MSRRLLGAISMTRRFLVTGATGATGKAAVLHLLSAGVAVRVLVHREDERSETLQKLGAEIVKGDLLDFEAVRSAMEGVEGAYFVYPIFPGILQATGYFAQAAKEAQLKSVVNMSQISARREATSHAAQDHWIAEQVFNWSGIPVTHLRPTLFAEWALYWVAQIKTGTLALPFGTGKHAPIAAEDQGRVIANILLSPAEHIGQVYPLYGPKEYSFPEIAEEIGKTIGKPLAYRQITAGDLKDRSKGIATKSSNEKRSDNTLWQHFEEIAKDHQNGIFAGTDNTVERLTGQPPMSLQDFLHSHLPELTAA